MTRLVRCHRVRNRGRAGGRKKGKDSVTVVASLSRICHLQLAARLSRSQLNLKTIPGGHSFGSIVHIADWWRKISHAGSINGAKKSPTKVPNVNQMTAKIKVMGLTTVSIPSVIRDATTHSPSTSRINTTGLLDYLADYSNESVDAVQSGNSPNSSTSGVISNHLTYEPYFVDLHNEYLIPYMLDHGMIGAQPGAGRREAVVGTEIEASYLAYPRLQHMDDAPNEFRSRVVLISPPNQVHKVGDKIQFRVDLYDLRGKAREGGGDEVRAWLTTPLLPNTAVAAHVTDLGNGSYVAETILKWTGLTLVRVALTYPREFLRALVELRHELHTTRWITAIFNNRNGSQERTPCLPYLPVPGFYNTCNLTSQNGDMPWYCGHPSDPVLNCSHWARTENLAFLLPLPLSDPELQLIAKIDSPRRETWELPAPTGWLRVGSWQGLTCSLPDLDVFQVRQCLRNTSMLLLGDSNARLMFSIVKSMLGCPSSAVWHAKIHCEAPWLNATLTFAPHARPFNVGAKQGGLHTLSIKEALRALPNNTNHIIVLHYFMHFSLYPLSVFRDRVRAARQAIQDLLETRPEVKILIRGPHVLFGGRGFHAILGDNFGPWYIDVLKKEFKGLYDKVWFLDFWDMSIAAVNRSAHPPTATILQMLKVLFGHIC
ncbi:hypothetical protein BaRGS_00005741 [Batillaria attramentaria]|uniref:NXPE C-terminal domain-containing protein n=1 Tax=Batillaria attramentaria TaxID=370345 RepID=A0ABD0LV44_9CAEN